jgi:hypothetical protein
MSRYTRVQCGDEEQIVVDERCFQARGATRRHAVVSRQVNGSAAALRCSSVGDHKVDRHRDFFAIDRCRCNPRARLVAIALESRFAQEALQLRPFRQRIAGSKARSASVVNGAIAMPASPVRR